jgi:hypothetical protein
MTHRCLHRWIGVLLVTLMWGDAALAQDTTPETTPQPVPEVTPDLDTIRAAFTPSVASPLVGQPFRLTLTVELPPGAVIVQWPPIADEWRPFMVRQVGDVVIERSPEGDVHRQTLDVILWIPGPQQTPETFVGYQLAGNSEVFYAPFSALTIDVPRTVEEINSEPRPYRPVIWPFYLSPFWIAVGALITIAAGYSVIRWRRRRLARRQEENMPRPLSPDERALTAITRLKDADPVMRVEAGADILRDYVAVLLRINTVELTTHELEQKARAQLEATRLEALIDILEDADLVKFASARPTPEFADRLLARIRRWIKATVPTADESEAA